MNREIKFRGKTISGRFWIYGMPRFYKSGRAEIFDYDDSYFIIPKTVCQYTGLKDKNGVEIYDGDVLCDSTGNKTLVEWDEDAAKWSIGNNVSYSRIIIGNIYDNPDLLNSKTS